MIIFFDFDDTLFDRERFISALAEQLGMSHEEFLKDYNRHFKSKSRPYSFKEHLNILGRKETKKEEEWFLNNLSAFVYPNAYKLIRESRHQASRLILLSYGDEDFQRSKIKGSGLADYFDEVVVTRNKVESLKKWYSPEERMVFINDRTEENKKIKKVFPELEVVEP